MNLVALARVLEIETNMGVYHFPKNAILAASVSMREYLYAICGPEFAIRDEPSDDAVEAFETFHGYPAQYVSGIDIPEHFGEPQKAVSVLYESDKLNGGGDGRKNLFRHRFRRGTVVEMGDSEYPCLRIYGPTLYVDDRGICN